MKTPSLFLLALFLLAPAAAYARLGETPAECDARYGPPRPGATEASRRYSKNNVAISITFRAGHAETLYFAHDPEGVSDLFAGLPSATITALLEANKVGGPWTPAASEPFQSKFTRGDAAAVATKAAGGSLMIETTASLQRRDAENAATDAKKADADKARVDGF